MGIASLVVQTQPIRLTPCYCCCSSSCSSSSSSSSWSWRSELQLQSSRLFTIGSCRTGSWRRMSGAYADAGAGAGAGAESPTDNGGDVVVQYVVLRRDLIETWPLGSVVTQGCHASVAAIWGYKDDPQTLLYCDPPNLDSMHKVTLEVKGEPQLLNLSEKLKASGISHKLWIEQPENIPTCLASKPYPKSVVSSFFKKLKLCK